MRARKTSGADLSVIESRDTVIGVAHESIQIQESRCAARDGQEFSAVFSASRARHLAAAPQANRAMAGTRTPDTRT
jgi:hypothetical protein